MKKPLKLTSLIAAGAVIGVVGIFPATITAAEAAPPPGKGNSAATTTLPVSGTTNNGGSFAGSLSGLTSQVVNGVVQLTGSLTGTVTNPDGSTQQVTQNFSAPVTSMAATQGCQVLNLDLGPLNLNLLGLVVDLAPVSLDITAVPGAGNLLGNLVCAIAGLLDGGGPLNGISALLNRLLSALGLGL
ncbi:hypothetical protein [Enemella evansiae]|uniref:hypothetical protein n=1 Tax=Enemella evansiae TaxID=2016499 RepID=UPI000B96E944|nr:hypothetical protein [Enemella evansiae]OYO20412.1 ABC transporter substrate-binding protein [Enemella evansiae]TDO92922.1 hypothetical protein C8D81_0697 [Enemella evansiae]